MAQIDNFYKDTWSSNIILRLQQLGSKFRGTMMFEPIQGNAGNRHFIRRYGVRSSFSQLTNRNESPARTATPRDNRVFSYAKYGDAEIFDNHDELKTQLMEPNSELMAAFLGDGERNFDDVMVAAFDAAAITGNPLDGTSTTAFDTSMRVAVNFVEKGSAANSDITLGKIREAKRLLDANFVPPMERYIGLGSTQINKLLRASELQSTDFYKQTIRDGMLAPLYGFNIVESERLTVDGSSYREVPFWHKSAMKQGETGYETHIDENQPEYQHSTILTIYNTFGAVRVEEEGVGQILCDES